MKKWYAGLDPNTRMMIKYGAIEVTIIGVGLVVLHQRGLSFSWLTGKVTKR